MSGLHRPEALGSIAPLGPTPTGIAGRSSGGRAQGRPLDRGSAIRRRTGAGPLWRADRDESHGVSRSSRTARPSLGPGNRRVHHGPPRPLPASQERGGLHPEAAGPLQDVQSIVCPKVGSGGISRRYGKFGRFRRRRASRASKKGRISGVLPRNEEAGQIASILSTTSPMVT